MDPIVFERKEIKFAALGPQGRLYFFDLRNRRVSQFYDIGSTPYQKFQNSGVLHYVDIGEDGETLYYITPVSKQRIAGDSEEQLRDNMSQIFQTKVGSNYIEESTIKGDFVISTSDRSFWADDPKWSVRYTKVTVVNNNTGLKCKVFHCRTSEQLLKLSNDFELCGFPEDGERILPRMINDSRKIQIRYPPTLVKYVGNARIEYFHGKIDKKEVFVKRIPKSCLDVIKAVEAIHSKFSRLDGVVKHLLSERDERYYYCAYEKMDADLLTYIRNNQLINRDKAVLIRGIVAALEELHFNNAFHHNIAPEHVLIKQSGDGVVVKLCGLGSSILTTTPFILDNYGPTETLRLGLTLWTLLSDGKHVFQEGDMRPEIQCGPMSEDDVIGLDPIPTDLVGKLVCQNISLEGVRRHPFCWDENTTITFLEGVSERITSNEFSRNDFNTLSYDAFGSSWLLESDPSFRQLFVSMNNSYPGTKTHAMEVPTAWQKTWRERTFYVNGVMRFYSGYNTTELVDLLKLIRNVANHHKKFYPANDKRSLHDFVSDRYPHLVMVVYNYTFSITNDYYPSWC